MQVMVRAVGLVKNYLAGKTSSLMVEINPTTTVHDLLLQLDVPENEIMRVAVNNQIVPFEQRLLDGDEVRLIPPIAGG